MMIVNVNGFQHEMNGYKFPIRVGITQGHDGGGEWVLAIFRHTTRPLLLVVWVRDEADCLKESLVARPRESTMAMLSEISLVDDVLETSWTRGSARGDFWRRRMRGERYSPEGKGYSISCVIQAFHGKIHMLAFGFFG
jgi:hypothetical protein